MTNSFYNKIQASGKVFRLKAKVGKMSLSLVILAEIDKELHAYKSTMVLEQHIKKQAEGQNIDANEYFNKLSKFIETPNDFKVDFVFSKSSLTVMENMNSQVRVKYFHCDIIEVYDLSSIVGEFIDEVYSEKKELQINHSSLIDSHNVLKCELDKLKDKLNNLISRKENDDKNMLSNFVSLLNEKKRRILHLSNLLESYRSNPTLAYPSEVNINIKRKRKHHEMSKQPPMKVKEEVSESESNSSGDENATTDSEKNDTSEVEVYTEDKTVVSQFVGDIFGESPPKLHGPLKYVPCNNKTPINVSSAGTSKENEILTEIGKTERTCKDGKFSDTKIVDTQEWIEGL